MAIVTSYWLIDVGIVIIPACIGIYVYFQKAFQKLQKRGFTVTIKPSFPSGHFQGLNKTRSADRIVTDIYEASPNEQIVGCYMFTAPILIVRDLDLAKDMLIKEFTKFHDRGIDMDIKKDPLGGHLFLMNGQEWRNLRIKLTPTFTSGKMKMMFNTLLYVGKTLEEALVESTKKEEVDIKDFLSRFTIDVISSVVFGLEANSLKNPDVEFRKLSLELDRPTFSQIIMATIGLLCPKLAKHIPIRLIPKHISDFFIRIVRETMEYRMQNNKHRNDFMQLLLELKTLGYVKDADNAEKDIKADTQQKFTLEQAAAQAFLFFFAGFETSSSTLQFALYELALNPDLQQELRKEIDQSKADNRGEITYEAIMKMELLDRIMSETLRKYPVSPFLVRECNAEYKVPGTDLLIKPKDKVWFPTFGYQHDEKYYPNPEKFNPDRFLPEIKDARHPCAYMPFGEGPRNCIGNRFGLMQTKTGLALILSRFIISPSKNTLIPMEFNHMSSILQPKGGVMPLKLTLRQ